MNQEKEFFDFGNIGKFGFFALFFNSIMEVVQEIGNFFYMLGDIYVNAGIQGVKKSGAYIQRHNRGFFYFLIISLCGTTLFFILGASFHIGFLVAIGAFFFIAPFVLIAVTGQALAYLISLYIEVGSKALNAIYGTMLTILRDFFDVETDIATIEADTSSLRNGARTAWMFVIPLGLVSIFTIFFPYWKSIAMIPVTLFIIIIGSIMVMQWADIDWEADSKKLISTAKAKRRIYKLVMLGLTLWLIWTAFSVTADHTAAALKDGTVQADTVAAKYINSKGSIFGLATGIPMDIYNAVADPIKAHYARQDSIESARKRARQDSIRRVMSDSVDTYTGYIINVTNPALVPAPGKKLIWQKGVSLINKEIRICLSPPGYGSMPPDRKSGFFVWSQGEDSYVIKGPNGNLKITATIKRTHGGDIKIFVKKASP